MTVIRLQPQGKKFQRTYRVVVDSKRAKLGGKNIEDLGWINRHTDEYKLNEERVKYWLGVGAQPSDTVYNLFVNAGLIEGDKRSVHAKKKISEEDMAEMEEATSKSPEDNPESPESDEQEDDDKELEKPKESEEEEEQETDEDDSDDDEEEEAEEEKKEE